MLFEDLAPYDFFSPDCATVLRAIGWIERGSTYATGIVDRSVYNKLLELRKSPWQPVAFGGRHGCDLCQYESEAWGSTNLFIPGNGVVYICPELITHYMNAHQYLPPVEFCRAVIECPPMRSMEYLKALLANGRPVVDLAKGPPKNTPGLISM